MIAISNRILLVMSLLLVTASVTSPQSFTRYADLQNFLQRMETRGVIPVLDYNNFQTLSDFKSILSAIDTESLNKAEVSEKEYLYQKYFGFDKEKTLIGNNILDKASDYFQSEQVDFFHYADSQFTVKMHPVLQIGFGSEAKESKRQISWGWSLWGSLGNNFEFGADFLENSVTSKHFNRSLEYDREPGHIYSTIQNDNYQFSETNGSFLYHNDFMTIGVTKEKMKLGSGIASQFVLSEKAPTFPAFYLKISPVEWLDLYSMHGWLISRVTDTSRSYPSIWQSNRTIEYEKYFVMHALQLKPWDDLSITLGETIIYSDRGIYPGYLIPFLFYRSVDHQFTFGSGESGNNGSIFFEVTGRPLSNVTLFSSVFIDEISFSQLLKGETKRNQFGYTFGVKTAPISDLPVFFNAEYSRILPWVYSNWIPTQTYRNSGYLLGHYIGQNADQLYAEILYHPKYNLKFKLWGELIRRGEFGPVINQYTDPGEPFLYGKRRNETSFGLDASYEFLYNMYVKVNYRYSDISDEDVVRTLSWEMGRNHSVMVSLNYGI